MTDRIDHGDDAVVSADFEDEVRRMLRRRAADVPDERSDAAAGGGGDPRPIGPTADIGPVGPTGDHVIPLDPTVDPAPFRRRIGVLGTVAAVVVAAVGIGLAGWIDGPDQQVAVGGATVAGPTVLVPPEGDAFTLDWIDVAPQEESTLASSEYGPVDGGVTDGVTVLVEAASDGGPSGGTPVTSEQSEILAELGAVFEAPTVVSWRDPVTGDGAPSSVVVLWYGSSLSSEQGLAIAAAVALDPLDELDGEPLPAGWALRSTSAMVGSDAPLIGVAMSGPWSATITSIAGEFSLGLWLIDWGDDDSAQDAREVEVRGGPGLLVERTNRDDDGTALLQSSLMWHEGGATHRLGPAAPTDADVDLVALADRLIAVDLDEARRRTGQDVDEPDQTTVPTTVTTTGQPPLSMTAPGPGAIEDVTATTGPVGQTTAPDTTTTEPPPSTTEGAGGSTVVISTTEPLARPAGEFLANAIVPVMAGTIGSQSYEVGVVWSPTFGFCMGVDLDGAITDGGFPVACEIEPLIGGAGSRLVPGAGVLVFAFADAATTAATVDIAGVTGQADVHRVEEFPDFSLLVFTLEADIPASDLLAADLPGAIALFDQAGQPVGWG